LCLTLWSVHAAIASPDIDDALPVSDDGPSDSDDAPESDDTPSGFSLGGLSLISVDDENVVKAANAAINDISGNSNSGCTAKLAEITKAEYQVVAGFNYELELRIKQTDCPGPENEENGDMTCWVTVHDPLDGDMEVKELSCIL